MTKDEYFNQLVECQEMYNKNWESYTGNDYGGHYPGQMNDVSCIPFGV